MCTGPGYPSKYGVGLLSVPVPAALVSIALMESFVVDIVNLVIVIVACRSETSARHCETLRDLQFSRGGVLRWCSEEEWMARNRRVEFQKECQFETFCDVSCACGKLRRRADDLSDSSMRLSDRCRESFAARSAASRSTTLICLTS